MGPRSAPQHLATPHHGLAINIRGRAAGISAAIHASGRRLAGMGEAHSDSVAIGHGQTQGLETW
jgi:hypothetical protein